MTHNPLDSIRIKIERAKRQIVDLQSDLRAFFDSNPYKIGVKKNDNPRQVIYYAETVADTPTSIPVQAGEAIHSLRVSLDHLATQLVLKSGEVPTKTTAFPIFKNAAEYKAQCPGKIKGMRQEMIDVINAIEPYKGGSGDKIWALHELDIIDKHRVLLTTPARYDSFNVSPIAFVSFATILESTSDSRFAEIRELSRSMPVFLRPSDPTALKQGDELLVDNVNAEVNKDIQFRFEITLCEPGIIEGEPLIETITEFANVVDCAVTQLGAFL